MLKEICELFSGNKKEIGLFIGGDPGRDRGRQHPFQR